MSMPLISVIMSTYNESIKELEASINSVLEQTYYNIEFVIICDNPDNKSLLSYLKKINDSRVNVVINEQNMGLVRSLNRALEYAHGEFIARMDADDICIKTRISDQYNFLIKNHCDLVGSFVELIDENNNTIKALMKMPTTNSKIKFFIKYGSCICHPTWFARKEVYTTLNGYRDVPNCEDYDFIVRAIRQNFVLGNLDKVELKYRIRATGISKSNAVRQYLLRDYLSGKIKNENFLSQHDINQFLLSDEFKNNEKKMIEYTDLKKLIKNGNAVNKITLFFKLFSNPFFKKDLIEKTTLYLREM